MRCVASVRQATRVQAMQIYVNIVERGNFTPAAEVLQLHRPAVTQAVQQLEAELGIRLLNRSTRRVSTTAEGEAFYQRCVPLLANVNETFASFAQFAQNRPQPTRDGLEVTTDAAHSSPRSTARSRSSRSPTRIATWKRASRSARSW